MKQNEVIVSGSSISDGRAPSIYQTVSYAFLVVGAISIVAIAFNYGCKIHLKIGVNGVQMDFDGISRQL